MPLAHAISRSQVQINKHQFVNIKRSKDVKSLLTGETMAALDHEMQSDDTRCQLVDVNVLYLSAMDGRNFNRLQKHHYATKRPSHCYVHLIVSGKRRQSWFAWGNATKLLTTILSNGGHSHFFKLFQRLNLSKNIQEQVFTMFTSSSSGYLQHWLANPQSVMVCGGNIKIHKSMHSSNPQQATCQTLRIDWSKVLVTTGQSTILRGSEGRCNEVIWFAHWQSMAKTELSQRALYTALTKLFFVWRTCHWKVHSWPAKSQRKNESFLRKLCQCA